MEHLFGKLRQYAAGDIYPYHMPGHKRRPWGELPRELYEADITEIEGFDNLHEPEEILLELQKKAARLYGAEESFYLVNGSTGGILCALSSALPSGGHILLARNCHKSAYHGSYLRNLKISYLWPSYMEKFDIWDGITAEQVQDALEKESDIGAVLIVSPTYEGRISDIGRIAEAVHSKGLPLIVDEAHGAHLGLAEGFSENSCQLGADLVIHSVHKTLPSLTQTALLHVNGKRINRDLLRRFLHIYHTSSPSYLLMAGIDNALQYVEQNGKEAFGRFRYLFESMMEKLKNCRHLYFLREESLKSAGGFRQDVGKLLISVKAAELTGKQLYDILLGQYHLQTEMVTESFVLAMFTVNDGEEAYGRMTEALLEIDAGLGFCREKSRPAARAAVPGIFTPESNGAGAIPLFKAWDMPVEQIPLEESTGRYGGEFVNLYPPGTPILVPGERITEDLCRKIRNALRDGLKIQGIETRKTGRTQETGIVIKVLCDSNI